VTRLRIASALLGAAVIGIAGGFGVGMASMPGPADVLGKALGKATASGIDAAPLGTDDSPSPGVVKKTPVPDPTEPLVARDLDYRTRTFIADRAVRSKVSLDIPKGWDFTQPEADEGRFTDPLRKRWIRAEAGFLPQRPTADSLAERIRQLKAVDPAQDLTIISEQSGHAVHTDGTRLTYSTLVYTYIPLDVRRYVMVRWISFGKPDLAAVEMSTTGLPKDREALESVLQRATQTVTRTDSAN
jgi:hypothetical protein